MVLKRSFPIIDKLVHERTDASLHESLEKISIRDAETILDEKTHRNDRQREREKTGKLMLATAYLASVIWRACHSPLTLGLLPRSYPGRNLIRLPFESTRLEPN